MRTLALSLLMVIGTAFASYGQKYGYIDSDFILENMPEYVEAKEKLDKFAKRWQKEIQDRYVVIKKKKDEFDRVEAVLPDEEREARKLEIETLENETLELQQLRFGVNGDLFAKRKELIQPIQDKVFEALEKVASKGKYAFVFDKANQSNLIFADPKYDLSKRVLRELGVSIK
ncbi:OmpH family outer membrane protein [Lishizhenia sp.]|uniref:OmpH family outer membrane protein n=1 Tax=Lishizhenia sp. TaxID=2497594 RepID=UPI00299E5C70|nr:OmpH family outer membrane protein [Lishizhenia sp.]MDX1445469.1 OmpH family outer membrane protein [Lishizhenia sp.]